MELECLNPNLSHWPISTKKHFSVLLAAQSRQNSICHDKIYGIKPGPNAHVVAYTYVAKKRDNVTQKPTHSFNNGYSHQHITQLHKVGLVGSV